MQKEGFFWNDYFENVDLEAFKFNRNAPSEQKHS